MLQRENWFTDTTKNAIQKTFNLTHQCTTQVILSPFLSQSLLVLLPHCCHTRIWHRLHRGSRTRRGRRRLQAERNRLLRHEPDDGPIVQTDSYAWPTSVPACHRVCRARGGRGFEPLPAGLWDRCRGSCVGVVSWRLTVSSIPAMLPTFHVIFCAMKRIDKSHSYFFIL